MVHEMREIWYWKCSTFEVSLKSKYTLNQLEMWNISKVYCHQKPSFSIVLVKEIHTKRTRNEGNLVPELQ